MERKYKEQVGLALIVILFLLGAGTIIFHYAEGWRYVDAFYFTGVTVTTIGYGDMVPTHDVSKVITVVFGLIGIGIVFYTITMMARLAIEREQQHIENMLQRRVQRRLDEEKAAKAAVEKEVAKKAKEVEKEAVELAKEMTQKKGKTAAKKK